MQFTFALQGQSKKGIELFWAALSGRGKFLGRYPRAMPSATMDEAFGLKCQSQ
jgi:hypothetical protein